jgi:hypothetical protein
VTPEQRAKLAAVRELVRGQMRALRTLSRALADLEESLSELDAQPEEAQRARRNHTGSRRTKQAQYTH